MGYSTNFKGVLKFKDEPTGKQLARLDRVLSKDRRDLNDIDVEKYMDNDDENYWHHIDLEITKEYDGIQWNGSEKTYELQRIVNWVTRFMREEYPNFELLGELSAQGEEYDDRWSLVMNKGWASKVDVGLIAKEFECPCCNEKIKYVICPECEKEFSFDENGKPNGRDDD